jgi:hypothetical protein
MGFESCCRGKRFGRTASTGVAAGAEDGYKDRNEGGKQGRSPVEEALEYGSKL